MQRNSILLASTSLQYTSQYQQKLQPVILFIIHYKKLSVLMVNLSSMGSTLSVHLLCCPFPLFSWQRKLTKGTLAIVASCLLCRPQCSSLFTCMSWIYTSRNTHNYNKCFKLLSVCMVITHKTIQIMEGKNPWKSKDWL